MVRINDGNQELGTYGAIFINFSTTAVIAEREFGTLTAFAKDISTPQMIISQGCSLVGRFHFVGQLGGSMFCKVSAANITKIRPGAHPAPVLG